MPQHDRDVGGGREHAEQAAYDAGQIKAGRDGNRVCV